MFFAEPGYVGVTLAVRTGTLRSSRYTTDQLELLRNVYRLRDVEKLTFKAIAERLSAQGFVGARGTALTEEGVFATYNKRQVRQQKFSAL